jgi:spermidine synthase
VTTPAFAGPWFADQIRPGETLLHAITQWHYRARTPYQHVEILELQHYGKTLLLDGKIQSTLADEFIYHESLVHPALITHPNPRRVGVIGGGEGATLREGLRYRTVIDAVMVDIDAEVVDTCRRLLPEWSQGAFEDPRTRLVLQDARRYLEENDEPFDVLIVDITDPLEGGPSYRLFTKEFYELVWSRLTMDGLLAVQSEDALMGDTQAFSAICRTLAAVFPVVRPYAVDVPSFGVPWGFSVASKGPDPLALSIEEVDRRVAQRLNGELRFYDGLTHQGLLGLPRYLRDAIAAQTTVIRDETPLFVV